MVTNSPNKYLAILDDAWQAHLSPRQVNAPTVISTFAGAGGSSLGYSMAGYRELLAVEWDDNAVETFNANFHDVPVYHGDIAQLTVQQVFDMTGLKAGELDVFDGSPPCQGFSTAGKRMIDDPRNQLFREYVRLLNGLQPKAFVMENVSGMVKGKMKLVFAEILRELKACGYQVSARLLNAMYFNVPQSRQRMIFIGVRSDLGVLPSHPKAQSKPFTVKDAFEQVISETTILIPETTFGMYLRQTRQGEDASKYHPTKAGFAHYRLDLRKPSPTIVKSPAFGKYPKVIHPTEQRGITTAELKRLGSYPDHFSFCGEIKEHQMRIGNSVPPLFMRAIATHIREQILSKSGSGQ